MLDRLKPAWRLFKFQQSMEPLDRGELLALLDGGEDELGSGDAGPWMLGQNIGGARPWQFTLVMLMLLLTCCHGG